MKICVICLEFRGGMIRYASQLANSLSKNNEVYMITSECMGDIRYFEKSVNVLCVPMPPKNRNSLKWFRMDIIIGILRDIKPDVIHITNHNPLLIPISFYLRRYPIVFTCHDTRRHPGDTYYFLYPYVFSLSLWVMMRLADKIIVHGKELKEQMVNENVSGSKIEVIPHGDYSFFTRYGKDGVKEENAVLFFGRIVRYKGIEYLIRAEPLITEKFPNVKVVIAGRGDFSEYEDLIEHKKNFEIINEYIPDEKVAELFQKSRIVVLPYIEASQSGIVQIAYAFKKPVVATNVGAIPEVVDNGVTGFIVPPRDSEAIADAIIKLLQDEKSRKQMGENAYLKMKEEFSWNKIAEKMVEVYKTAIKQQNKIVV